MLLLPLICGLMGCEWAYCVTRSTPLPSALDLTAVEKRLRDEPHFAGGRGWDGEEMLVEFRRGEAHASVVVADSMLSTGSCWINRVPDADLLTASLDLQSELIRAIRETCAAVPPEADWHLKAEPDVMHDQLEAARRASARRE